MLRWYRVIAALALACATPAPPRPSALDPSSPDAPPGVLEPVHPMAAATEAADAGTVIYTCPMHPEVRSQSPGRCPKCGMALVPEARP